MLISYGINCSTTFRRKKTRARARHLRVELRALTLDNSIMQEYLLKIDNIVDALASIGDQILVCITLILFWKVYLMNLHLSSQLLRPSLVWWILMKWRFSFLRMNLVSPSLRSNPLLIWCLSVSHMLVPQVPTLRTTIPLHPVPVLRWLNNILILTFTSFVVAEFQEVVVQVVVEVVGLPLCSVRSNQK